MANDCVDVIINGIFEWEIREIRLGRIWHDDEHGCHGVGLVSYRACFIRTNPDGVALAECHDFFSSHYKKNRSCFTVVMRDIGLCIGIDYGATQLVSVQDWLTPIGTPVVYACRLSGAEAGYTLLAQQAHDEASRKFGRFIDLREYEQPFKHQGTVIPYAVSLAKKAPRVKRPDWLASNTPLEQ